MRGVADLLFYLCIDGGQQTFGDGVCLRSPMRIPADFYLLVPQSRYPSLAVHRANAFVGVGDAGGYQGRFDSRGRRGHLSQAAYRDARYGHRHDGRYVRARLRGRSCERFSAWLSHSYACHALCSRTRYRAELHACRGREERDPGIIAPLKVRGKAVGTLKFYYRRSHEVNRTQYALASGFAELISTQLAIHELELQSELTARAEVRALQAQINPHFLFNTLNTIAALTRTEPLRARELLREFASFYRATLDNSGSLMPVSREIEQTLRYLTFEKARFGEDRIGVNVDIDEEVEDTLVPAFVIQPLVENAVRHAMGDEDPLHIDISVAPEGESMVQIQVKDDGVGMDEQTAARLFCTQQKAPRTDAPQGGGAGVAMHNIADRIARFYGPRSSTQVISSPGAGTSVVLHLDLQKSILE